MKKITNYLKSLNLNVKLEKTQYILVFLFTLLLGAVLVYFKLSNYVVFISLIPLLFIVFKIFNYSKRKDKIIQSHEDEFVNVINYIEIFISNKFNVYNAFLQTKTYTSDWMRDRIDELLNDIDNDKSVEPFIKFAHNFKKPICENVMVAVFQMVEEGENSNQLNQFDILFQRFSENHNESRIERKARQIDSLASLPLIGAGMVTLILTLGIMTIMGDIINVI